MEFGKDGMPELSKDEVLAVAKALGASDKLTCRLKALLGRFESGHLFLVAKDWELKKLVKYGPRMAGLVKRIREKCYFLNEEEKAKLVCSEYSRKWLAEKEREYEEKVRRLNPVFTYVELERILDMCKGLEFVDVMEMNRLRGTMTLAHQERLRVLYERAEKERQKEELEGLDKVADGDGGTPGVRERKGGDGNGAS